ncbi:lysine-specific demethylase RSBN1L-like [Sycon ciliatum]|uniref:lysine-specific demethylase RSBN1L-like n=1 Tax=Sycon ciliatum TaxID=27933 RepID=UPI0031F632C5
MEHAQTHNDETHAPRRDGNGHTPAGGKVRIEACPAGGATYVVLDNGDFCKLPDKEARERVLNEYFDEAFSTDAKTGQPRHVMAIVRGAAECLPDPFLHLAKDHPQVVGQVRKLLSKSTSTTTLEEYYESVQKSLCGNCSGAGPLNHISLVGTVSEEVGGYFPEMLERLEESPFLQATMPWGRLSKLKLGSQRDSNDGPILWVRPGEQMISSDHPTDQPAAKRIRKSTGALADLYSQKQRGTRETLFEDRTYCHADQVAEDGGDGGIGRHTTCAVGVLKAVTRRGKPAPEKLVVKDVIAFSASSFTSVAKELSIDVFEPPASQCTIWVCQGKLNAMHRALGPSLRYARIQLHANDIYFIPRNVIHQFQTMAACTSIAWHLRYLGYANKPHLDLIPSLLNGSTMAPSSPVPPATTSDSPSSATQSPGLVRRKRKRNANQARRKASQQEASVDDQEESAAVTAVSPAPAANKDGLGSGKVLDPERSSNGGKLLDQKRSSNGNGSGANGQHTAPAASELLTSDHSTSPCSDGSPLGSQSPGDQQQPLTVVAAVPTTSSSAAAAAAAARQCSKVSHGMECFEDVASPQSTSESDSPAANETPDVFTTTSVKRETEDNTTVTTSHSFYAAAAVSAEQLVEDCKPLFVHPAYTAMRAAAPHS